jgi:hypothetical protein
VTGVVAYAVGVALTWVLAGTRAARLTVGGPFGGSVPDWKAVVWVFYDSHFVGTRTPEVFGPGGGLIGGGDLVDTVALLDVEFLYVVPVVVLFAAGAFVAAGAEPTDPRDGLRTGLTVVTGYLPPVVLGLLVATEGGVAPSPLRALVVAGVLYPVALGGIGGLAVGLLADESAAGQGDSPSR